MNPLQELLTQQLDRRNLDHAMKIGKLEYEIETEKEQHRRYTQRIEDARYQLPKLIDACLKAKLTIDKIVMTSTVIQISCNPKGFSKMNPTDYSKQHTKRREERAKKIEDIIKTNFECKNVICNQYSLEGDGYILVEILN
jgi:hypothetical protein